MIIEQNSRIGLHSVTPTGYVPTIPASEDFTDGSWLTTDLGLAEIMFNMTDDIAWWRSDNGIIRLANASDISIKNVLLVGDKLAAGQTFDFDSGNANDTAGTVTLVAGTATVNTTAIDIKSIVFLTHQIQGGTIGTLYKGTVVAGTSFDIRSTSITDTSTIGWMIINTH